MIGWMIQWFDDGIKPPTAALRPTAYRGIMEKFYSISHNFELKK